MFNNTGIGGMAPVDQMSGEEFRKLIDINLTGVFYGIKYAALQMEKQGNGGAIVSTSSIEGCVGDPMLPHYNAAKGGVNLLTKSSALALAKYGIRVNTVSPGYIETGMVNEDTMGKGASSTSRVYTRWDASAAPRRLPTASSSWLRTSSPRVTTPTSTAATPRSKCATIPRGTRGSATCRALSCRYSSITLSRSSPDQISAPGSAASSTAAMSAEFATVTSTQSEWPAAATASRSKRTSA